MTTAYTDWIADLITEEKMRQEGATREDITAALLQREQERRASSVDQLAREFRVHLTRLYQTVGSEPGGAAIIGRAIVDTVGVAYADEVINAIIDARLGKYA